MSNLVGTLTLELQRIQAKSFVNGPTSSVYGNNKDISFHENLNVITHYLFMSRKKIKRVDGAFILTFI